MIRAISAGLSTKFDGLLHRYPLMGDFMSYQVAIDLNYSDLLDFSENDFTQPGPGALRGIKKAFEDLGSYTGQRSGAPPGPGSPRTNFTVPTT